MLYRWALAVGVLGVVATMVIGNAGLATILAALVVPIVCLATIGRARGRHGWPMVAVIVVAGIGGLAGAGLALLSRQYVEQLALVQVAAMSQGRPPLSLVLFLGVTLPLVGELLKLPGPLVARRWVRFRDEVRDEAGLGVASGVGFAAASTLVNYWPIIRDGYTPVGTASLLEWTMTLVGLAVLRPLVHGTTTGLVMAGIWAVPYGRGGVIAPVLAGLGGSVIYSLGELLLLRWGTLVVLVLHGLVLALLLVMLRHMVRGAVGGGRSCGTLSGCDE
jgi:RsiW-degrading membrane proteinase PrsW (M82 family)